MLGQLIAQTLYMLGLRDKVFTHHLHQPVEASVRDANAVRDERALLLLILQDGLGP